MIAMKKWGTLLLALGMLWSLSGCGSTTAETAPGSTQEVSSAEETASIVEEAPAVSEVQADEPDSAEEETEVSVEEAASASEVKEVSENIVTVIKSDGEIEETTIEDLLQAHTDNELRFQDNYVNAQVILTGAVSEIDTNETVFVDDLAYSPKVTVHLDGGWVIGVPSTNELVAELSAGDTIQVIGTITGYTKYGKEIAVLNTTGHETEIALCGEEDADLRLFDLFTALIGDNNYRDASTFIQYYIDAFPENTDQIEKLSALQTEIETVCYPGTYIKTYDKAFSSVTSVSEVNAEQYGIGYDYYDPSMASNVQTYGQYIKNRGYTQESKYVLIEVDGQSDPYLQFTSDDDSSIIAMAQGDGYVRVIVYSAKGMVAQILDETAAQ
jgi:TolA-binding protein